MPRISLITALLMITAFTASCASYTEIQSGLRGFVGKDVDLAIAKLGEPDQTFKRKYNNVYIWETGERRSYPDEFNAQGATPGYGTDVSDEPVFGSSPAFSCAIKLTTNPNDIVVTWEFERGLSSCSEFRKALAK